ncbi:hypothetical protein [Kitasatospora sp. NPDC089509]
MQLLPSAPGPATPGGITPTRVRRPARTGATVRPDIRGCAI